MKEEKDYLIPLSVFVFCPNSYYNMYPEIRDSQTKYIENKETDFGMSLSFVFNFQYFKNLDILNQNYTKVDNIVSIGAKYYLYKKNNND